uniref:Ig-like domain-containing protein n=1 Tax=Periophthalmus magnuspinnatus TaxID=409849 RepID=A0A3B4AI60_9GOBI
MNSYTGQEEDRDITSSWAMIRKGGNGHVQTALEGSKVKLDCNVIASEPQIKVEWMLPDMSILENSNNKIEITQNGELVILNVTLLDSGVYHCMIKTIAGVDLVPFRVTIKEKSLSPKAFNGKKFELEKGDSLTLPCNVTSAQPSQTLWYLPKNQILLPTQQTRHAQVMNNGTLVVKKVTSEDAGEYSCLASNLYGVDMIAHVVEVKSDKPNAKIEVKNYCHCYCSNPTK